MPFPGLPWFIREEIITLVIEDEPNYYRVNREWYKLVAGKYGFLRIGPIPLECEKSSTLSAQHIKKVEFTRTSNIDWKFVYSHKQVTDISIRVHQEIPPNNCNELFTKCLQLPPLENLKMTLPHITRSDFSALIKANQLSLKRLSIATLNQAWQLAIQNMRLSKLVHLDMSIMRPTNIQKITNVMPNLNSLCLVITGHDNTILFNDFKLTKLTKLNLINLISLNSIDVNLASIPNINNLALMGDFDFMGKYTFDKIIELKTNQAQKYFIKLMLPRLPNLQTLNLEIFDAIDLPKLRALLQRLTTLSDVRLNLMCPDSLERLPPGPYAITDLNLDGVFYTSPYLLHWLNSSFKLLALDLHACYLEDRFLQGAPKFKYLSKLTIRVKPNLVCLFSQNFNKKTHSHINFIRIKSCNCTEQGDISFII